MCITIYLSVHFRCPISLSFFDTFRACNPVLKSHAAYILEANWLSQFNPIPVDSDTWDNAFPDPIYVVCTSRGEVSPLMARNPNLSFVPTSIFLSDNDASSSNIAIVQVVPNATKSST